MPKIKSSVIRRQWPAIVTVENHGSLRYRVDCRPVEGRKFFSDRAESLAYATQIARIRDEGGSTALNVPAALRVEAVEAAAILESYGKTLLDAARFLAASVDAERAREKAWTVDAALDAYLESKRAQLTRKEIAPLTFSELESKTRIIRASFVGRRIVEIDEPAVQAFVDALPHKPRGKDNIRIKFSQFLNFCRRQKWIATNPAGFVKVRVPEKEVAVLTLHEVERLLKAAEDSEHSESVMPYLLVSVFAGLRPGEAEQLNWKRINFETGEIEVLAETSKTRAKRFVRMEDTLLLWLAPYRRAQGRIIGTNFLKDWKAVRAGAGYATNGNTGKVWPVDCLRHSFGSYWLATHNDRPRLAETMGNTVEVIRDFYRKAIPQAEAKRFWNLRSSENSGKKIVAFSKQA